MDPLQIPDTLGALLLPECTLFPHGALPLHIFEPRYREMLTEAVEGSCVFCVGTLTAPETPELESCTSPVGTAGLIRASREADDGRSNLLLHGLCRVRFVEWLDEKPFPYARVRPIKSTSLEEPGSHEKTRQLREAVEAILLGLSDELVSEVRKILDRAPDPEVLTDAVAQQFVKDPLIRQTLLEEQSVDQRISQLVDYLRTARSGDN
ncbi:MAG: LON peptidase substrate-binding domain-containing protein [Roseibacillus sp.]|nr:LON peptidase substrate-binding domain-containing protein [Roseibacillus sp.]